MMNNVAFMGRLTRQPSKYTTTNGYLVTLDVAINEPGPNGTERTTFVHVVLFGKVADACLTHLVKGQMVTVEGRLSSNQRNQPDGSVRTELGIVGHSVHFGEKPRNTAVQTAQNVGEAFGVEAEAAPAEPSPKKATSKKTAGRKKPQ